VFLRKRVGLAAAMTRHLHTQRACEATAGAGRVLAALTLVLPSLLLVPAAGAAPEDLGPGGITEPNGLFFDTLDEIYTFFCGGTTLNERLQRKDGT
jgi:hypothetical protein